MAYDVPQISRLRGPWRGPFHHAVAGYEKKGPLEAGTDGRVRECIEAGIWSASRIEMGLPSHFAAGARYVVHQAAEVSWCHGIYAHAYL